VDANNSNNWKHKDSIAEMLRLSRQGGGLDGVAGGRQAAIGKVERESQSAGEFGEVLKAIFQPSSKADIKWKEAQLLGKETIHVFNYKVGLANSDFQIDGAEGARVTVGFYGQVFIDATTHNIRRVTLTTSSLGKDPAVHPASITVDYDTVAICGQSYLLPVAGRCA